MLDDMILASTQIAAPCLSGIIYTLPQEERMTL